MYDPAAPCQSVQCRLTMCSNRPWEIFNVHPLSHGCVPMDHGMFQMVLLCPMGHCQFPMVLSFLPSPLSHGHVVMDHGTLFVAHGPVLSCITSVPLACCNRPWDISNVHPLSHGTLNVAHGPALSCVTSVPWACANGPWDVANVWLTI